MIKLSSVCFLVFSFKDFGRVRILRYSYASFVTFGNGSQSRYMTEFCSVIIADEGIL